MLCHRQPEAEVLCHRQQGLAPILMICRREAAPVLQPSQHRPQLLLLLLSMMTGTWSAMM